MLERINVRIKKMDNPDTQVTLGTRHRAKTIKAES